jgi:hypothetical protein
LGGNPRRRAADSAHCPQGRRAAIYSVSQFDNQRETPMKTLSNLAALTLSLVLGLIPFAMIAVNDYVAVQPGILQAQAGIVPHDALGTEQR